MAPRVSTSPPAPCGLVDVLVGRAASGSRGTRRDSATCSKISRVSSGRPFSQVSSPTSARIFSISSSRILRTWSRSNLPWRDPLPDLRAGDLGRGGVLHQVVDARRAAAAEPERDVLEADVDVAAQALLGDLAGRGRRRRAAARARRRRRSAACRSGSGGRRAPRRTRPAPTSTTSGCATQVPSKPALASRSLSALTASIARWLASSSLREGISAAMPPIANAPWAWQVLTSSSV